MAKGWLYLVIYATFFSFVRCEPVELAYACLEMPSSEEQSNLSPILLLHGLGTSRKEWMGIYQVIATETGRKVCIPDIRNHGDSPWSDEMTLQDLSDDLVHLMDHLGIFKTILIGHSMGGQIAATVALQHPDRVEKLIVEDMRPYGVEAQAIQIVKHLLILMRDSIYAVPPNSTEKEAKAIITKYVNERFDPTGRDEGIGATRAEGLPIECNNGTCSWKMNFEVILKAVNDPDSVLARTEGSFQGKTLFIYGSKSPFKVKDDIENIFMLFPNAKLVEVEGALHNIHSKHPEFLEEVLKFVA